jgi:hypothetical protein
MSLAIRIRVNHRSWWILLQENPKGRKSHATVSEIYVCTNLVCILESPIEDEATFWHGKVESGQSGCRLLSC